MEASDPYKELFDNLDMISPVKRCPECRELTLKFDPQKGRIYCTKCGFERYLQK
ncbi:MAG: hypothetical protein ABIG95_00155 [Candidatus Woesearchaeota archaeon]